MAIFLICLLCIPLIIFIIAESTVIYWLINIISETLFDEGLSASTMIDGAVPSLTAIIWVLGLIVTASIIIWIYIRFIIISSVRKMKNEKEGKFENGTGENGENIDFIEEIKKDTFSKPIKKKTRPSKKIGLAVASMVFGIVSIALSFWIPIAAPVGLVLGIISLYLRRGGKVMAIIGIVLSIISIAFYVIVIVLLAAAWGQFITSLGLSGL